MVKIIRTLFAALLLTGLVCLSITDTLLAGPSGGKVDWAANYPKMHDVVPPAATGTIESLGTYTAGNAGWAADAGSITYNDANGGSLVAIQCHIENGEIGS